MINLENISQSNQANRATKSADKISDDKKIDAVQNIVANKKVTEDKKSSHGNKKRHKTEESKLGMPTSTTADSELESEMYDNRGKKQPGSRLNLKA